MNRIERRSCLAVQGKVPCVNASVKITASPALIIYRCHKRFIFYYGTELRRTRILAFMAAGNTAETTVSWQHHCQCPRYNGQTVIHPIISKDIILRWFVRGAATVKRSTGIAIYHQDAVDMIEAAFWSIDCRLNTA